jgi:hypothetical protein
MKRDEYVQYVTEKIVSYYDQPKEERKNRKVQAKQMRAPWMVRWFGMMPFSIRMYVDEVKLKRKEGRVARWVSYWKARWKKSTPS